MRAKRRKLKSTTRRTGREEGNERESERAHFAVGSATTLRLRPSHSVLAEAWRAVSPARDQGVATLAASSALLVLLLVALLSSLLLSFLCSRCVWVGTESQSSRSDRCSAARRLASSSLLAAT